MRYEFEMTDAESINFTNMLERVGNRLIDMAMFTSKMSDLSGEIKNLKEDMQRMREDRAKTDSDMRTLKKQVEFLDEKQQNMLEDLDSKSKK
jgi:outer membrane murein-binding lipoprotein Lpp